MQFEGQGYALRIKRSTEDRETRIYIDGSVANTQRLEFLAIRLVHRSHDTEGHCPDFFRAHTFVLGKCSPSYLLDMIWNDS